MMTKEQAIQCIESLYPVDAPYEDTAIIGTKLLQQAKNEITDWRAESEEVLARYAQLCIERENSFKGM